jgi:hypothetical protein
MSKKRNHKRHFKPYIPKGEEFPIESDHYFAFIMGYTSGGAAYGITHEEWRKIQDEETNQNENLTRCVSRKIRP